MTKEELKPIDTSKYKITETGQVLKMTKEECEIETSKAIMEMRSRIAELEKENAELEKENCELLGIIQGKDKVIQELEKEN